MSQIINIEDIGVEILPSSSTLEEDVYRCLLTLYGSRAGEQALDRDFGLDIDCLSQPTEAAEALFTSEIARKTARYEPRVRVVRVDYQNPDGNKGEMKPKVVVELV